MSYKIARPGPLLPSKFPDPISVVICTRGQRRNRKGKEEKERKKKKRGGYYKTLRRVSFHDGNSYIRQEAYGAFRISRPRSALPLSSPRSANPSRPIAVPFFSLQTAVEMSEGSAMLLELGLAPFCFTIFLYHL